MSQQRKRAKRIERNFFTRIRIHHSNLDQESSTKWDIVTTQNLSSSGILFNYNQKIPVNTILEFKISFPFDDDVHCLGVVRRIEQSPPFNRIKNVSVYRIAAYIVNLDIRTKAIIDNLAEKLNL